MVTRRPRTFPVCIGGRWNAPPEHCGNGEAYMNHRERIRCPFEVIDLLADLLDEESLDAAQFRARAKKVAVWGRWMYFDRRQLGTSLRSAILTWDEERVDEEKDGAFSFATGN